MKDFNKVLGGLFGVACGDALGGTLETLSIEEATGKYGYLKEIVGGGPLRLLPGEVTDDTGMTIAIAKGLLEEPDMPWKSIGKYFLEWGNSNPKGVGRTISTVLEEYRYCQDWGVAAYKADEILGGKSAGNGSLMRCIPIGLYYDKIEMVKSISKIQSGLTHYDKTPGIACELYNTLIHEYLLCESKAEVLKRVLEDYPEYKVVYKLSKEDLKPTAYVVDSLLCALWCFKNTSSFEEAVCEAVNLCGDADTIGAITGGLAGVFYGFEEIPARWRDKILVRQQIMDIANNIFEKNKVKAERFKINEVTGIETYVGDSMGTSIGVKVNFELSKAFYNVFGEGYKKENEETTVLSKRDLEDFINALRETEVQKWSRKYVPYDNETEGVHWSVKIRCGRKSYQSLGENWFPDNWMGFCKSIEKLVGHDFK